jgi:isocitrate lyase
MFELSKACKEKGMAGFSQLQQKEFALQEHGFKAVKHQTFVGTGYFDYVQNTVQQGIVRRQKILINPSCLAKRDNCIFTGSPGKDGKV